uniref:Small ribosomal subunit protein bS6 n=1 Tax=Mesoaciditoga lauensis TaxID=1495039 RepID=A0A7V3RE01_9BACT
MKIYETLFIVDPTLDEEARNKLVDRVKNQIEEKMGGQIRKVDRWGVRQLAFRIGKFFEGDYTIILFDSDPSKVKTLEDMYRVIPEIFRHLTVRREDIEKHPVVEKVEEAGQEQPVENPEVQPEEPIPAEVPVVEEKAGDNS